MNQCRGKTSLQGAKQRAFSHDGAFRFGVAFGMVWYGMARFSFLNVGTKQRETNA
jgi:hypothetical protein